MVTLSVIIVGVSNSRAVEPLRSVHGTPATYCCVIIAVLPPLINVAGVFRTIAKRRDYRRWTAEGAKTAGLTKNPLYI
jgi:hypothetical protein